MMIQRQQIVHLRQQWILGHKSRAAAAAAIDTAWTAQAQEEAKDTPRTSPSAAAVASTHGAGAQHAEPLSSRGLDRLEVDTSPITVGSGSPRPSPRPNQGGAGTASNSPRSRRSLDAPRLPASTPSPRSPRRASDVMTPLHASASEFLRRELVKLKLEGFLDTRTDVSTLAAEFLKIFSVSDVQWIFGQARAFVWGVPVRAIVVDHRCCGCSVCAVANERLSVDAAQNFRVAARPGPGSSAYIAGTGFLEMMMPAIFVSG